MTLFLDQNQVDKQVKSVLIILMWLQHFVPKGPKLQK